jgi:hypothetical protein
LPGIIFGYKNNCVTNFFDIDFGASKLKVFWQDNDLVSTISAEFGGVHGVMPSFMEILAGLPKNVAVAITSRVVRINGVNAMGYSLLLLEGVINHRFIT